MLQIFFRAPFPAQSYDSKKAPFSRATDNFAVMRVFFLHTGMVFYAVLCYTASGFFADSYLQTGPHIMILVSLSEDSKQYGFTE